MGGIEVGIISVVLIVALIYLGLYIPVALGLVSFLGVWVIRDNPNIAKIAATNLLSPIFPFRLPIFARSIRPT